METKTILIMGPEGVGKTQIFENLTTRTGFQEKRNQTINGTSKKTSGELQGIQIMDTPGAEKFRGRLPGYFRVAKNLSTVLVVIDQQTLMKEEGLSVLKQFLNQAHEYAPEAAIKIVVNKVEAKVDLVDLEPADEETAIKDIEAACKKIIVDEIKFSFDFNPDADIIYYSAKKEAEAISNGKELKDDPIIQAVFKNSLILKKEDPLIRPVVPKENLTRNTDHIKLDESPPEEESGLVVFGKILLFLLIAATLTVVFGAIGMGIGMAAGAWSGPGAFATGLAGLSAGVVTAAILAVVIVAPVLGFTLTGIGFGLWHRDTSSPPPDDSVDIGGGRNKFIFPSSDDDRKPIPGLTVHRSNRVVGDKPPEVTTKGGNTGQPLSTDNNTPQNK